MRQALPPAPCGVPQGTPTPDLALPLASALAVLDAVGRQFCDAAPSRTAATLVQSVLWLIAAKLEAEATALAETGAPRAAAPRVAPTVVDSGDSGPLPTPTPDSVEPPREPAPPAMRSPSTTTEGPEARAASVSVVDRPAVAASSAPARPLHPPRAEDDTRTAAPSPTAKAAAVSVRSGDVTSAGTGGPVASPAPPRAEVTVGGSNRALGSTDQAAPPPDEYDGLCAVGSRLFAAARAST